MATSVFGALTTTLPIFSLIENYIYLYHTDTLVILPSCPDSISDSTSVSFAQTVPMSRTAPIYSYQNSGPRQVQFNLTLHRDMMSQINAQNSRINLDVGEDYIDNLIRQVQSIAYPRLNASERMVDPPMVAVKVGDDVFCKGIINGAVGVTYRLPIIRGENGRDRYGVVDFSFTVNEVDPYDAETVATVGSYRGLSETLEKRIWKSASSSPYTNFSS